MVVTLTQRFLSDHPKQGQPTFFAEKFLNGLGVAYKSAEYFSELVALNKQKLDSGKLSIDDLVMFQDGLQVGNFEPLTKLTTIRARFRWKNSSLASVRVWSKKPYYSPQIILFDDLKVKVAKFTKQSGVITLNGEILSESEIEGLAQKDGLSVKDLLDWFDGNINGQQITFLTNN